MNNFTARFLVRSVDGAKVFLILSAPLLIMSLAAATTFGSSQSAVIVIIIGAEVGGIPFPPCSSSEELRPVARVCFARVPGERDGAEVDVRWTTQVGVSGTCVSLARLLFRGVTGSMLATAGTLSMARREGIAMAALG